MSNKDDLEVPKWRKMSGSGVSHSSRKSKHKHEYEECAFLCGEDGKYYGGQACRICGKVSNVRIFTDSTTPDTPAELPLYKIYSIFDKIATSTETFVSQSRISKR